MVESAGSSPAFDIARSAALDGISHGFFGHSNGQYQFGYGGEGDAGAIARQRALAADAIASGAPLVAPHQVHSPEVVVAVDPWDDNPEGRPVADAVVTGTAGIVLGIVTADCTPVLFADTRAGVIGATHAGWRGAHSGVLENTITAMEKLGAERTRISAAIGPTIAQESYEVDDGFRAQFGESHSQFFAEGRPGHWQFDLPAYVATRLATAGLGRIDDLALDTYAHESRFYSYRRATHRGEPNYGRQLSLIALA